MSGRDLEDTQLDEDDEDAATVLDEEDARLACAGGGAVAVPPPLGASTAGAGPPLGASSAAPGGHFAAGADLVNASAFRGIAAPSMAVQDGYGEARYKNTQLSNPHDGGSLVNIRIPPCLPDTWLRLMTFNINGIRAKATGDRVGLAQLLGNFSICALQELKATEEQVHEVLRSLRLPCPLVPLMHTAGGSNGVGVLLTRTLAQGARITHVDFLAPGEAAASALPDSCKCRSLTVDIPAAGFTVLCVHRFYVNGVDGAPAIVAHVAALQGQGKRVVVMGDLNAWPEEERDGQPVPTVLHDLAGLGLLDCTHGTSEYLQPSHFPHAHEFNFQRLDYIMLPQQLCRECLVPGSGRVLSKGAPWGDHVPVECTLRLAGRGVSVGEGGGVGQ